MRTSDYGPIHRIHREPCGVYGCRSLATHQATLTITNPYAWSEPWIYHLCKVHANRRGLAAAIKAHEKRSRP